MPRRARIVVANVPYLVAQSSIDGNDVFFTDQDRLAYLHWLKEYADYYALTVLAYALLTDRAYLVAVPSRASSLHEVLKPLHMRYAQLVNRTQNWTGAIWRGRYRASALDDAYTLEAIRYVETAPVRAGLVRKAETYRWSSARAHCSLVDAPLFHHKRKWQRKLAAIEDWVSWLRAGTHAVQLALIQRNLDRGLPCGGDRFINRLERCTGLDLQYRPRGRPRINC